MPLLFQYGSNTNAARLNDKARLAGAAEDLGRAETVDEYDLAFNVWSGGNGCAASDLIPVPGTGRHSWGVIYELPAERILGRNCLAGKTMEEIEGRRYEPKLVRVRNAAGEEVEATTFLVKTRDRSTGLCTSAAYVTHIVDGLRAHNIPEEYVQRMINTAIQTNRGLGPAAEDQTRLIEALREPGAPSTARTSRSDL
jgi:hypothetical protein